MFQVKASPLWQMLLIPLEKLEIEIRFFFEWLIEIVKMHRKYKVNFPIMMNVEAFKYIPTISKYDDPYLAASYCDARE